MKRAAVGEEVAVCVWNTGDGEIGGQGYGGAGLAGRPFSSP